MGKDYSSHNASVAITCFGEDYYYKVALTPLQLDKMIEHEKNLLKGKKYRVLEKYYSLNLQKDIIKIEDATRDLNDYKLVDLDSIFV